MDPGTYASLRLKLDAWSSAVYGWQRGQKCSSPTRRLPSRSWGPIRPRVCSGGTMKLVDKFTYLRSSILSTKNDINARLTKAWTAINRLLVIWKSDLANKIKHSFFLAVVVSILLYGRTTWMLTKRMEKKLEGNYTRMQRAVLNTSRRQHPTKQHLYGHLPPITKTIQVRRTRHAGEVRTNS